MQKNSTEKPIKGKFLTIEDVSGELLVEPSPMSKSNSAKLKNKTE